LSQYLLDNLADATIEVDQAMRGKNPVKDGTNFQPFLHSAAPKNLRDYHRRVLLHDRSDAFRDMREALVLPVPSTASFPVTSTASFPVPSATSFPVKMPGTPASPHSHASPHVEVPPGSAKPLDTLVFSPVVLGERGEVVASVSCDSSNAVLWEETIAAAPVAKVVRWPEPRTVALPEGCGRVVMSAKAAGGNAAGGTRIVWESPRIENATPPDRAPKYNVIYIVVDALRSDAVGVHRTAFPSVSPEIDMLEKSGTTFPNGYSNGNTTLLSMNAMLLGAHPRAMGFLTLWWGGQDRRPFFYERRPTFLTRTLHRAGYYTYGAVHNHLFFPGYIYGVDPGFDALQDCGRDTTDHTILTDRAIEFMRANSDRRFMLELNLLGPHQPYAPPKEYLEQVKQIVGKRKDLLHDVRYLGEVAWVDLHVGRLMAALDELGLRGETLVILTADHGEVMDNKHSCFSQREQHACLHLHGLTLYEEEINVPMMFSLPGVVKAGQVAQDFAQHVDLVPTILDLVGVTPDPRLTGRSLKPVLLGSGTLPEAPVYSEKWLARAFRKGNYKIIHHSSKDDICPPAASKVCKGGDWYEMYDLSADPHERSEMSRSQGSLARDLVKEMLKFKADLQARGTASDPSP